MSPNGRQDGGIYPNVSMHVLWSKHGTYKHLSQGHTMYEVYVQVCLL